jgi:CDP-glycerol glycerophosphotransferase (TagB/SpsB family)
MNKIITFLNIVFSWMIYIGSYLSIRDKKIWIFTGWHKNQERETFGDNSKYLFLHIANTHKDIRAIWIASDEKMAGILRENGYTSYSVDSVRGIYYSLRAGYTFIDAIFNLRNWRLSGTTKVIQIWHGDGIKSLSLGRNNISKHLNKFLYAPNLYAKYHLFISSSHYLAEKFICPSFDIAKEKVLITGHPRFDVFFNDIPGAEIDIHDQLKNDLAEISLRKPKKIILYAPTFRRGNAADSPIQQLDLIQLDEFLRKEDFYLFISLHPKFSTTEWVPKNHTLERIRFSNPDLDKYPLLPKFDMLITDYSSICLEFLLMNKPVIFYIYDFEEYKRDPGIQNDIWDSIPGVRVKEFDSLLKTMSSSNELLTSDYSRLLPKLFEFERGKSSELITRSILKDID